MGRVCLWVKAPGLQGARGWGWGLVAQRTVSLGRGGPRRFGVRGSLQARAWLASSGEGVPRRSLEQGGRPPGWAEEGV